MMRIIEKIHLMVERYLDKKDEEKKKEAMKTVGLYTDRHGRKYFDTTKYCGYGRYRKFC